MFYDISSYSADNCFDIVWGCHPPETPSNGTPKHQFFERLKVEFYFFWYQQIFYRQLFWHSLGVPPPRGPPQMDPPKINFLNSSTWVPVCFDISRFLTNKFFDMVWGCHPPRDPPNRPPKINFWTAQARVPVFYDISRYLTDKYFDSTFLEVP